VNAHQGAQFCDIPTGLPQTIVLDEDDADTTVAGGLDFIEGLRSQSSAENEWSPWLEERAERNHPEGSVIVELSQESQTVFSEVHVGTNRNSDREDVIHNNRKPIASLDNSESRPINQLVSVPLHTPDSSNTTISKIKGFLRNNVIFGVFFIIVVPTVVGVAVGFGRKSLMSGTAVGGTILTIFIAVFAYLHVMWKKEARARARAEGQQRGGSSYCP
jgi:hypothetical protein